MEIRARDRMENQETEGPLQFKFYPQSGDIEVCLDSLVEMAERDRL